MRSVPRRGGIRAHGKGCLFHRVQQAARMRATAQIPDVRIHDLRHAFASLLVSGGASLEMIGRLLGHTQAGITQRYAHLIESPLRTGVNAVGQLPKPRLRVVGT